MNHELTPDVNDEAKKWESLARPDVDEHDNASANGPEVSPKPAEALPKNAAEALMNREFLGKIRAEYAHQYERGNDVSAASLACKESLDGYVMQQLNGANAAAFLQSEAFRNYAETTMWIAQNRTIQNTDKTKTLYPELSTNPVLRNEHTREAVLRSYYQGDALNNARVNIGQQIERYDRILANIEGCVDRREKLSQAQIDVLGDYIYTGHNYEDGRAKKLAEYCFNEIEEGDNLEASVPIIGALANYFAKSYTIDEDVRKKSRIFIADGSRVAGDMHIGVSTNVGCVLEKNHFLDMSLTSDESLKKSRTNRSNDLYRLMMITFHEVTHDHQRFSLARGEDTPSAMAYATNQILRRDVGCIPDKDNVTGAEKKVGYYKANHDSDEIEIDADEEAWRQSRLFLVSHCKLYGERHKDIDIKARFWRQRGQCVENEQEVRARRAFTRKKDHNGDLVNPMYYDVDNLSAKIGGEPAILQQYPIFRKFFEDDGSLKLSYMYDSRVAASDREGFDTRTDNMGAEFGAYMINERPQVRRMVDFINQNGAALPQKQCERLIFNMYNVLHQSVLQLRDLNKVKFVNYDETRSHMDSTSQEIKDALLLDYLRRLYNCTWISERLRAAHPELSDTIDKHEKNYFVSYYDELTKNGSIERDTAEKIVASYEKTQNPSLMWVAARLRQDYDIAPNA